MIPSYPASFINLDLEVHAVFDLTPIADFMINKTFVLFNGPTDSGFHLSLEPLIEGALSSDLVECTHHFIALLMALPPELKVLWRSSNSRVFDYGFEGGVECPPLSATLPADVLSKLALLEADVNITLYPWHKSASNEQDGA